jgi:hypothetical protein
VTSVFSRAVLRAPGALRGFIFLISVYHGETRWHYSANFSALLEQRHLMEKVRQEW